MKMTVVWLRVAGEEGHMLGLGAGVVEVNEIDSALVMYRRGKGRHGRGRGRGKGRSYEISTSENASLGDSQNVCHGTALLFSAPELLHLAVSSLSIFLEVITIFLALSRGGGSVNS
ncbi:hypothetical protein Peur_054653 [Populus x canadensis]